MDPSLLAQLKQLELRLKPSRASSMLGRHELRHRGRSLEFAGYREYRPGDDLRELDWKLLGRTQRHYIKQPTHTVPQPRWSCWILRLRCSCNPQMRNSANCELRSCGVWPVVYTPAPG